MDNKFLIQNRKFKIATLLLFIAVGCTDAKLEQVKHIKQECLRVHDEVMPHMGALVSLSGEISAQREALVADTTDSAAIVRTHLTAHAAQLDSAHEAMMAWMYNYEPDYENAHPADSAIIYYERQLAKISEVAALMTKSMEDGKSILGSGN